MLKKVWTTCMRFELGSLRSESSIVPLLLLFTIYRSISSRSNALVAPPKYPLRLAPLSPPSRPFMGPICLGRNHSQIYRHMRAKFGHDRTSRLAAYTWQTDTQNLYYKNTSWLPGFARDPPSLALPPIRPSLLPSLPRITRLRPEHLQFHRSK